jgi:serine/threonine protein kinase
MSNYNHPIRDPNVGTILDDRYYLQLLLGRGATSSVYEATDARADRSVAVKLMHSHLVSEHMIVRRFEQEAKTSQLLQHPNIAKVEEHNVSASGVPYLIMELVRGTSLHDVVKGAGWLPIARALAIFSQVCAALAAAHEKSIVHRDLKPSNIMLATTDGGDLLVKVLDFGIAKQISMESDADLRLTQAGEALGSLLYMSPEQCLDQDIDNRSDCYSLGCVMYEALTGKPPLCARTAFETMNKQISEMPERLERVRPDLNWPEGLEDVVFKAMQKNPAARYQNISDLLDDLQKIAENKDKQIEGEKIKLPGMQENVGRGNRTANSLGAKDNDRFNKIFDSEVEHNNAQSCEHQLTTRLFESTTKTGKPGLVIPASEIREPPADDVAVKISRRDQLNNARGRNHENAIPVYTICVLSFFFILAIVKSALYSPRIDSTTILISIFFLAVSFCAFIACRLVYRETKQLEANIKTVTESRTIPISITGMSPTYPNNPDATLYASLNIRFTTGEHQIHKQLVIAPVLSTASIWQTLCTASQLASVSRNDQTFPLSALLFLDSNGKVTAVEVGNSLAWVLTKNKQNFWIDAISGANE